MAGVVCYFAYEINILKCYLWWCVWDQSVFNLYMSNYIIFLLCDLFSYTHTRVFLLWKYIPFTIQIYKIRDVGIEKFTDFEFEKKESDLLAVINYKLDIFSWRSKSTLVCVFVHHNERCINVTIISFLKSDLPLQCSETEVVRNKFNC